MSEVMSKQSSELVKLGAVDLGLLELAEEYGIDLNSEDVEFDSLGKRKYTNFIIIPDGRFIAAKKWQSSGIFSWNFPGDKDLVDFCFNSIGEVEGLSGVIVNLELKHGQVEWIESENKVKSHCTVLGYVDPVSGQLIKKLPNMKIFSAIPYKDMRPWDNYSKSVLSKPTPAIEALGFVGNDGRSCADCIKQGLDTYQRADGKEGYCSISAQAVVYVTHLIGSQMVKGKDGKPAKQRIIKSVEELYAAQDVPDVKGVLVTMAIPTALGLRGAWDKEKQVSLASGLFNYQISLNREYSKADQKPFRMLMFHRTNIFAKKVEGKKDFYLHFEKDEVPLSKEVFQAAVDEWKKVAPKEEVEVLAAADFKRPLPDNVIPMRSADPNAVTTVVVDSEASPF